MAAASAAWALGGCVGEASCFAAGTRIATPRGPRRIESLAIGDEVWSWDLDRDAPVTARITAVFRASGPILAVRFGEIELHVTGEHPFWDAARRAWRPARDLHGCHALAWFPGAPPRHLTWTGSRPLFTGEVWNLSVAGQQNFFAEGVLTHNKTFAGGAELWSAFPFLDETRTSTFVAHDPTLDHRLVMATTTDVVTATGVEAVVVETRTACAEPPADCVPGRLVRSVTWSSDDEHGVLIHRLVDARQRRDERFVPPIAVARDEVFEDQPWHTRTGGAVWTGVFVGFGPCDEVALLDAPDLAVSTCAASLTLDDGDDDPTTHPGLPGEYWAAKGLGIIGFRLEDGVLWGLAGITCEPVEACDGFR